MVFTVISTTMGSSQSIAKNFMSWALKMVSRLTRQMAIRVASDAIRQKQFSWIILFTIPLIVNIDSIKIFIYNTCCFPFLVKGFDMNINDGRSLYSIGLGANVAFLMPISSISNCMAVGWLNIRFRDVVSYYLPLNFYLYF